MKPKFYMLVGIPGAGKSSAAKELGVEKIFASDEIRKELWGYEAIQGDNKQVFSELHNRVKNCLKEGNDCIFDATNISSKKRKAFLDEIKNIDCEKICVLVLTDLAVCLQRNNLRDRKVPYEVIKNMYTHFSIPQYREGWDKIIMKRTRDENNDYDMVKFIDKLREEPHDNPHHLLTIGDHIIAATQYIISNYGLTFAGDENRLDWLVMAMFAHDIGKKYCKDFHNTKGEQTDIAHYYGHENVSAYMYLMYCGNDDNGEIEDKYLYIADLISLHMKLHSNGNEEKIKRRLWNIVQNTRKFQDLLIMQEADNACS